MMFSEKDIISQIKQGNIYAFEEPYFDMHPRLYLFSRKFVVDLELAKDIVQEVFFEFWEHRATIDVKISVKSYLFRMIRNKCLNQIRDQKIRDRYTSYTGIKLKEAELLFYDEGQESYQSIFLRKLKIF